MNYPIDFFKNPTDFVTEYIPQMFFDKVFTSGIEIDEFTGHVVLADYFPRKSQGESIEIMGNYNFMKMNTYERATASKVLITFLDYCNVPFSKIFLSVDRFLARMILSHPVYLKLSHSGISFDKARLDQKTLFEVNCDPEIPDHFYAQLVELSEQIANTSFFPIDVFLGGVIENKHFKYKAH